MSGNPLQTKAGLPDASRKHPMSARAGLPTFRVVGVRASGERIVISTHASHLIAQKVVSLIGECPDFNELRIEDENRRRRRRRARRKT